MPGELIPVVLFISMAAVAIFRPLTTRLGKKIERSQTERTAASDPQIERLMQLLERVVDRMDRLEDRVDFTERILERQQAHAQLTEGGGRAAERRSGSGPARPGDDASTL